MAAKSIGFDGPGESPSNVSTWRCNRCGNLNSMDQSQCLGCGAPATESAIGAQRVGAREIGPADFETLQFSPLWVFSAVAEADGKADKKEFGALVEILGNSQYFENPSVREVFGSVARGFSDLWPRYLRDSRDIVAAFDDVKSAVDSNLETAEAMDFKKSLLFVASKVAQASGSGVLSLGNKISKDEQTAFAFIAVKLGVTPEDMQ